MENLTAEEFKLPDGFSEALSDCLHDLLCKFDVSPEKITVQVFENTIIDIEGVRTLAIAPPSTLTSCKCYSTGCNGKPRRRCKKGECWDCR